MRNNQFFILLGLMAILGFVAGIFGGHLFQPGIALSQSKTKSIEAEEIVIVGSDGNPRILLNASDDKPTIAFYDKDGNPQLVISATKDASIISVNNKKGQMRAVLGVTEKEGAGILMKDNNGKVVFRQP